MSSVLCHEHIPAEVQYAAEEHRRTIHRATLYRMITSVEQLEQVETICSCGNGEYMCLFHNALRYWCNQTHTLQTTIAQRMLRYWKQLIWPKYDTFMHVDAPLLMQTLLPPFTDARRVKYEYRGTRPAHPLTIYSVLERMAIEMGFVLHVPGLETLFDREIVPLVRLALSYWCEVWDLSLAHGCQDWRAREILEHDKVDAQMVQKHLAPTTRPKTFAFKGDLKSAYFRNDRRTDINVILELKAVSEAVALLCGIVHEWGRSGGETLYHVHHDILHLSKRGARTMFLHICENSDRPIPTMSEVLIKFYNFARAHTCCVVDACRCSTFDQTAHNGECPAHALTDELNANVCGAMRWCHADRTGEGIPHTAAAPCEACLLTALTSQSMTWKLVDVALGMIEPQMRRTDCRTKRFGAGQPRTYVPYGYAAELMSPGQPQGPLSMGKRPGPLAYIGRSFHFADNVDVLALRTRRHSTGADHAPDIESVTADAKLSSQQEWQQNEDEDDHLWDQVEEDDAAISLAMLHD